MNGRIEMFFTLLKEIPEEIAKLGVNTGDKITTAVSYRYKKEDLLKTLENYFQKVTLLVAPSGKTAVAVCSNFRSVIPR